MRPIDFVLLFLSMLLISCSRNSHNLTVDSSSPFQKVTYNAYEHRGGNLVKAEYQFLVPSGYVIKNVFGDHEKEIRIVYPDSSIVYITNDARSGSALNYDNISVLPGHMFSEMLLKDTLVVSGYQLNKRIWKQSKLKAIVIGYVNVKPSKQFLYEKSIATIKKVK